jgi:uncharacterized protein YecT (DUF1311 family)
MRIRRVALAALVLSGCGSSGRHVAEAMCTEEETRQAVRECLLKEAQRADSVLVNELRLLEARGAPAIRVDSMHAAWLEYRRHACGLVGLELDGGTEQSVAILGCWITESRRRSREVAAQYSGP